MTRGIAYILLRAPRYSEAFISNELEAMQAHGIPQRIFTLQGDEAAPCHGIPVSPLEPDAVRRSLSPELLGTEVADWKRGPELYDRALAKTADRRARGHKWPEEPLFALSAALVVARYAKAEEIRHIHAHYATLPTEVAMVARRLCGVTYSFTGHAKDIFTMDTRRLAMRMAAAEFVVTCSQTGARHLQTACPDIATPVHTIYHGVVASKWDVVRASLKTPPLLVSAGRFTPKKGFDMIPPAAAALRDKGISVHFSIAGEGREAERIMSLVKINRVEDMVTMPGLLQQDQLRDLFSTATAFVHPSVVLQDHNQDGIANVVLEAMASGLPVVVGGVPALREVVTDGETGLVFEPGSVRGLCDCIERLLASADLQGRLSRAGFQMARSMTTSRAAQTLSGLFLHGG